MRATRMNIGLATLTVLFSGGLFSADVFLLVLLFSRVMVFCVRVICVLLLVVLTNLLFLQVLLRFLLGLCSTVFLKLLCILFFRLLLRLMFRLSSKLLLFPVFDVDVLETVVLVIGKFN